MSEPLDSLTLKGFGRSFDGEYRFDLFELIDIGAPDALTSREQHRMKLGANVRGAEVQDAVVSLDAGAMVVLASIVLARHDKHVTEERIWNTRMVYTEDETFDLDERYPDAILWRITDRVKRAAALVENGDVEADAGPPSMTPPDEQLSNGSGTTSGSSASPVSVPSLTGRLRSATPTPAPGSGRETSAL